MSEQPDRDPALQRLLSTTDTPGAPYGLADRVMQQVEQEHAARRVRRHLWRAYIFWGISLLVVGIGMFGTRSPASDFLPPGIGEWPLLALVFSVIALLLLFFQVEAIYRYWQRYRLRRS